MSVFFTDDSSALLPNFEEVLSEREFFSISVYLLSVVAYRYNTSQTALGENEIIALICSSSNIDKGDLQFLFLISPLINNHCINNSIFRTLSFSQATNKILLITPISFNKIIFFVLQQTQ